MDFRTNDRNYYYGILSVSQQSQSTDANTSTLAYSLTLYAGNTWFSGYTIGYRVKVDLSKQNSRERDRIASRFTRSR